MEDTPLVNGLLSNNKSTNKRTLQYVRSFYIYLFLIYQYGFYQKKSFGDRRSVVGAQFLPVGLNQYYLQSWVAAEDISWVVTANLKMI